MKLYRVEQGSAEWYRLRLGRPTASNFEKILTPGGKPSEQAVDYLYQLVAERLLNESQEDYLGYVRWVEAGRENEPYAIAHFQEVEGVVLEPGGFITTDDGRIGASPDRLFAGHKESLEVKCPAPKNLLKLHADGPAKTYRPQVQGQLFVGEFEAVHFLGYHPRMPHYHIVTLPDRVYQSTLSVALDTFCQQLDRAEAWARSLGMYSVVRRVETPADVALQAEEDVQLRIVKPGEEGDALRESDQGSD